MLLIVCRTDVRGLSDGLVGLSSSQKEFYNELSGFVGACVVCTESARVQNEGKSGK